VNVDCMELLNVLLEEESVYSRCKYNAMGDTLMILLWVSGGVSQSLLLASSD
jgi:hypothetical protein